VGGQRHAPAALPPGNGPGTHCIGGWVDPTAGLELTHETNQYLYLISGFRREVHANCALPAYHATSSGNSLPTFRDGGTESNNFNMK